ncbi:hypothetical protein Hanom_Chr13g01232191 [Helianthus anomalus]
MEDPIIFLLVSIGMFFNKTFHSINQNSVRSFFLLIGFVCCYGFIPLISSYLPVCKGNFVLIDYVRYDSSQS